MSDAETILAGMASNEREVIHRATYLMQSARRLLARHRDVALTTEGLDLNACVRELAEARNALLDAWARMAPPAGVGVAPQQSPVAGAQPGADE